MENTSCKHLSPQLHEGCCWCRGIAGLGLLNGCSKTEAPASSAAASAAGSAAEVTTTPAAAAPATDKLYTASINPQLDESQFRSNTKEPDHPCSAP